MRRGRLSIAHLLLAVLFFGVAFAALRSASEWWASGLFTVSLGTLLYALIRVACGRAAGRPFWIGFAIVGWGFLIVGLLPGARVQLATGAMFQTLYGWTFGPGKVISRTYMTTSGMWFPDVVVGQTRLWDGESVATPLTPSVARYEMFMRTGHSLATLALALAGGAVARRLAAGREEAAP